MSKEEKIYLLYLARFEIAKKLKINWNGYKNIDLKNFNLNNKRGTFVTLTINDKLRGCIGNILANGTIKEAVKNNAINAAFSDPRFSSLSKDEFNKINIELSILTEAKKLKYSDSNDLLSKINKHIDGVILKKDTYTSTFLPQVWDDIDSKKEFLSHLSLKAGLEFNAWEKGDLDVYIYQVKHFSEKEFNLKI
jgi:AmmeMemoRadiSam system protein A